MKNIPTPDKSTYYIKLIEKIESFIKRLRWKAYFFLNNDSKDLHKKETFGFKTTHYPLQSADLEPFVKDVLNIVNVIKFKQNMNSFQKQLKNDLKEIKKVIRSFSVC